MIAHPHPFDPTYGHDLPALLRVEPPPPFPGFEAFWREAYAQARAAKVNLRVLGPSADRVEGHEVKDVVFQAADGREIGGWLTVPLEAEPLCALVVGHGYGGRPAPALRRGEMPAVRLFYCTRGFHRSAAPDLPCVSGEHVVHGIASKETYLLRGCALDLWAAVGALQEAAPGLAHRLGYFGKSFGGGIGALAVPWDERLLRCYLGQPTFGNHPFRLRVPCVGSGEAVRRYALAHPEVIEVLRYFDAATAAAFLKIPAFVSCSLFDPAVPPPGQFAVHNAIPGPKILFREPAGHIEYPESTAVLREIDERLAEWFPAQAETR